MKRKDTGTLTIVLQEYYDRSSRVHYQYKGEESKRSATSSLIPPSGTVMARRSENDSIPVEYGNIQKDGDDVQTQHAQ